MICPHCQVDIQSGCEDAIMKLQNTLVDVFPGRYDVSTADSVAEAFIKMAYQLEGLEYLDRSSDE